MPIYHVFLLTFDNTDTFYFWCGRKLFKATQSALSGHVQPEYPMQYLLYSWNLDHEFHVGTVNPVLIKPIS